MAKPFRGVINVDVTRAAVDASGAPFVDLAAEARTAFLRD
jgi:hypothetical protein